MKSKSPNHSSTQKVTPHHTNNISPSPLNSRTNPKQMLSQTTKIPSKGTFEPPTNVPSNSKIKPEIAKPNQVKKSGNLQVPIKPSQVTGKNYQSIQTNQPKQLKEHDMKLVSMSLNEQQFQDSKKHLNQPSNFENDIKSIRNLKNETVENSNENLLQNEVLPSTSTQPSTGSQQRLKSKLTEMTGETSLKKIEVKSIKRINNEENYEINNFDVHSISEIQAESLFKKTGQISVNGKLLEHVIQLMFY